MLKDQVMENEEFQKYWLTHATPDAIFEWLREQNDSFILLYSHKGAKEIETLLIERHEPLLNLSLALYAKDLSSETLLSLFRNEDRTIKKAALLSESILSRGSSLSSFANFLGSGVLQGIIDSFDEELLESLLSNESVPDDLLVSLYEREKAFNSLTDKQWLTAIAFTASNPRISTPLDELPYDGWKWHSYNKVFTAGWELFETLPVNKDTAAVLSYLGENLFPCKPHDMDVFSTIKRWKVEDDDESDDISNTYVKCRYILAKLIGAWGVKDEFGKDFGTEFESLKESDDYALRLSYYSRFHAKKPEEIRKLFEKDNEKFLDGAVYNTNLYRDKPIRDELNQCLIDYEDPHPEMPIYREKFDIQVKRLTKEHPEWFPDSFDDEISFDEVEDPLLQANKRLKYLQQQTKVLSQKLIGSESEDQLDAFEDQPSLIDDINDVKSDISESNQQLSEQLSKVIRWGWVMLCVIIGLLLILI